MTTRERLVELFRERALRFGDFTLASGQKSHYYLDGKQVCLHSEGLQLVSQGLLDLLAKMEFTAIGGMSIGADPIIGGVLAAAGAQGRELVGCLVRKEPKGHGTQRYLEGPLKAEDRVVVIDDVMTTGGSALQAAQRIQEFGCQVVHVAGVVDRLQGAAERFESAGIGYSSLLTIRDLGVDPQ